MTSLDEVDVVTAELGTWAGAIGAAVQARSGGVRDGGRGMDATSRSIGMTTVSGRLVLADRVEPAGSRSRMARSPPSRRTTRPQASADTSLRYITPGFVDVHVHGGGGNDAMGDRAALDGMARHLLRPGVTSFLPTAVTAPLADAVPVRRTRPRLDARTPRPTAPQPLGFNLEGPFLAGRAARAPTTRPSCEHRRTSRYDRPRAAPRRAPARHDRPGAPGRARSHRAGSTSAASRPRWVTRRRRSTQARAGYAAGRLVHDPPVQRDERGRPPRPGPGGRRPDGR